MANPVHLVAAQGEGNSVIILAGDGITEVLEQAGLARPHGLRLQIATGEYQALLVIHHGAREVAGADKGVVAVWWRVSLNGRDVLVREGGAGGAPDESVDPGAGVVLVDDVVSRAGNGGPGDSCRRNVCVGRDRIGRGR